MKEVSMDHSLEEINFLKNRIKELEELVRQKESTERHLPEENILRTIMRLSPCMVVVTRLDGTIYEISDTSLRQFGLTREEVIGKTSREVGITSSQDPEKTKEMILRDGGFRNLENVHHLKNGSVFTCVESGEIVRAGNEQFFVVIVTDITAQKESLDALISERDFSKALIDSLPGWFYVINENYQFVLWNKNLEITTGYSADEIRKMKVSDLHREADQKLVLEETKKALSQGEHRAEADVVSKDGTVKTYFFNSRKIKYRGADCMVGNAIDVTDKKIIEQGLKNHADNLEDANIALRVLMTKKNADQDNLEEKLQTNINELVMPYLKKMKNADPNDRIAKYLGILEKNLEDILSPYMRDFQSAYRNLTPQEIQIVDMIRNGKRTKDIAKMLNASEHTVMTHRNNIRKKLKLVNSKTNLRTHILSLK